MPHTNVPYSELRDTLIRVGLQQAVRANLSASQTELLVNLMLLNYGFTNDFDLNEFRASHLSKRT